MNRSRIARHLWISALVFSVLVAGASCGSRTGLFLPDPTLDATVALDVDVPDVVKDATAEDVTNDVIEEPLPCIPGKFPLVLATPQLMFVLDRSGSMAFKLTSDENAPDPSTSRWGVLETALTQTITPFSNKIAMGARFFPLGNRSSFDPACAQDPASGAILPALGNAETILDVFQTTTPKGATPTAVALSLAAQELSASRAVSRAMVVATDGSPNCNAALDPRSCTCSSSLGCKPTASDGTNCLDDVQTVKAIATIFGTQKIPVYVIGIGATGFFANTLDAMAVAGGRPRSGSPKYYAADTPGALTGAFATIANSVGQCSYITPSSPTDPDAISVDVGGQVVTRDPNHLEGWDWIDQAFGHLQLFGAACVAATADNVSATVSCDAADR